MTKQRILVVDDEPDIRELLEITLLRMGLETRCAQDYHSATTLLRDERFDLCLTDMKLPDGDGIALVEHIQRHHPNTPTAVITAYGSIDLAIQAMKSGAFDFISKPVSLETLRGLVGQALTLPNAARQARDSAEVKYRIIGESPPMLALKRSIAKFARSQAPVFIQGQSGTGKELVARQIHLQGARAKAPFIAVNCGAIPAELMESEFFGHVKGSFTGASSDNDGLFKAAHGGTLFLDEIADLPMPMQVKLLRAIQEKSVRAVGSQQEEAIDARIISASHKNLDALVTQGEFRQDLYYRINVIGIVVPPLAERREDISALTHHILDKYNRGNGADIGIAPQTLQTLAEYPFPGNVRELENILERATALCDGGQISVADLQLPDHSSDNGSDSSKPPASLGAITQDIEKQQITEALQRCRWNQSAAARSLGITLRQLRYKMDKLELNNR